MQYLAWNGAGQTVSATRTVRVQDRTPPMLALQGPERMKHVCGSAWVDPGVQASDACYGELRPAVVKIGNVNGWVEGTYTITYSLRDGAGNQASPVTRTVEVVDCPW